MSDSTTKIQLDLATLSSIVTQLESQNATKYELKSLNDIDGIEKKPHVFLKQLHDNVRNYLSYAVAPNDVAFYVQYFKQVIRFVVLLLHTPLPSGFEYVSCHVCYVWYVFMCTFTIFVQKNKNNIYSCAMQLQ